MGVFEMVVALVFMSYMLQLAKLHYESRGNGQPSAEPEAEGNGAQDEMVETRTDTDSFLLQENN